MKNKILSIMLVAVMAISLVSCGTSSKEDEKLPTPSETEEVTKVPEVKELKADGIVVDGDFGTATVVSAEDVSLSEYAFLDSYLTGKTVGSVAYNITITDADGKKVQPTGTVNVTVDTSSISGEGKNYVVYYADTDNFERMEVTKATDTSVTFKTTHFSVYVISKYDSEVVGDTDFAINSLEAEKIAESTETESTEAPAYTVTELSATMYASSTVNVRSGPSTDYEVVGSLSTNQEVSVTGKCNETGWYRIGYNEGEAFVSDSYLSDEKVEVASSSDTTSAGGGNSNNGGSSVSVKIGDVPTPETEAWFYNNGWTYDASTDTFIPTEEYKTHFYSLYGKTVAQVKAEYNALGYSFCGPYLGQIGLDESYDNVVFGSFFQRLYIPKYGHYVQTPF